MLKKTQNNTRSNNKTKRNLLLFSDFMQSIKNIKSIKKHSEAYFF